MDIGRFTLKAGMLAPSKYPQTFAGRSIPNLLICEIFLPVTICKFRFLTPNRPVARYWLRPQ